ncbi:gamma-interferon-inducible lysosomal thiol reductase, partial [Tanacetum coccineum]
IPLLYDKFDKWESCFEELSLDPTPVKECYNSGYGNQLELQYADVTNSLKPPKKYVPWVVVDGKPLYDDYIYIVNKICSVYKGPTLPKACLRCLASPENHVGDSVDKVIPLNPVTYPEDSSNPMLSKFRSTLMSLMFKRNMKMLYGLQNVISAVSFSDKQVPLEGQKHNMISNAALCVRGAQRAWAESPGQA